MNIYNAILLNGKNLIIKADKIEMRGDTIVFFDVLSHHPLTGNDAETEDVAYIRKDLVKCVRKSEVK